MLAVPAIILGSVVVAATYRPVPVVVFPTGSSTTETAAQAAPAATASRPPRTFPASPFPPLPLDVPCDLPPTLPAPMFPDAAPAVEGDDISLAFTSSMPSTDGAGLWFIVAGENGIRLLPAPPEGMVLPLGMAATGELAVWWLPDLRTVDEAACESGIYRLSMRTGKSELVARGDWTVTHLDDRRPDRVGIEWTGPAHGTGGSRDYLVPEAAFSSDGSYLALLEDARISIYLQGETEPRYVHSGLCPDSAWSPTAAVFVAGCEDMTSAWLVDAGGGYQPTSIALPWLREAAITTGWGHVSADAIGFTRDGRIRVVGLLGFATGCEGPASEGCTIPLPAYVSATIGLDLGEASLRTGNLDFLVGDELRISADASWVYADRDGGGARALRIATGSVSTASRLRNFAGSAADGSVLFGWRVDEAGARIVISSLNARGDAREVATIRPAEGSTAPDAVIAIEGLVVADPG